MYPAQPGQTATKFTCANGKILTVDAASMHLETVMPIAGGRIVYADKTR